MNSLLYLDYIRQQKHCSLCYKKGPVEPHHIDMIGMGRNRNKPLREHYSAIPVCRPCHREYHDRGEKMYCIKHQINPYDIVYHYLSKYMMET